MKSKKPKASSGRSGEAPSLWRSWGSVRLTSGLLAVLLVFCVIATWIPQEATSTIPIEQLYPPEVVYLLRLWGLTDLFHSSWFISVLVVLFLNLFFSALDRLPKVWKQTVQGLHPIHADHIVSTRKQEKFFVADFGLSVGRESFREYASRWARSHVGRAQAVRDEGGLAELQLAAQRGRASRIGVWVCHLALVAVVVGAFWGAATGFEGQLQLDEGMRVNYLEILRGNTQKWPVLKESGQVMTGFYQPGFEIECAEVRAENHPGTRTVKTLSATLNFYEEGKLIEKREIAVNHPFRFRGLQFAQQDFRDTGRLKLFLSVRDRQSGDRVPLKLVQGAKAVEFDGAKVRVIEHQLDAEGMGPSVQIEYRPQGGEVERFWVFQKFPNYDEAHRKASRHIFQFEGAQPALSTSLKITRDPGLPWVVGGAALALVSLLLALFFTHNRFWFVWRQQEVIVVGWSNRMALFQSEFDRAVRSFKSALQKAVKP